MAKKKAKDAQEKKLTGIRLSPEILKKLKIFAAENNRSLNSVLNEAIENFLEKHKIKK
jgi:predicted transcriptional regulator